MTWKIYEFSGILKENIFWACVDCLTYTRYIPPFTNFERNDYVLIILLRS